MVDDFFGRPWVDAICAPEAKLRLGERLSRFDVVTLRKRLKDCYRSWISAVDPGLLISGHDEHGRARASIPISDRYVKPDVLIRTPLPIDPPSNREMDGDRELKSGQAATGSRTVEPSPTARSPVRESRVPVDDYLASRSQVLVVGEAGSGKSSLLRFLALDMLADTPSLKTTRGRFRGALPVWVSFALWARMASEQQLPPPIEHVVAEFFRAQGEELLANDMRRATITGRVALLVDGLDEAPDATGALTLLSLLTAFAQRHGILVVATLRPHGVGNLSGTADSWDRTELAPLSDEQRRNLTNVWFRVLENLEAEPTAPRREVEARAKRKANVFITAIQKNVGITRLTQTPLFLLSLMNLHRHGHDLPRSRFAASREIIDQLLEHQPRRRDAEALATTAPDARRRLRDRILADLAFALHVGELRGPVPDAAPEEEALQRAASLILERQGHRDVDAAEETARAILSFTEDRAGLLVKKALFLEMAQRWLGIAQWAELIAGWASARHNPPPARQAS